MSTIAKPTNSDTIRTRAIPVEDVVSDPGTVEDGAYEIGFLNSGSANVTVNGETLEAGVSKTYPYVGKQYDEISYNATGGELTICAIF